MSAVRVMPFADLTGRKVNTLTVGNMVSRNPKPRYNVTCECGASTVEGHDRLASGAATCRALVHNNVKPTKLQRHRNEVCTLEDRRRQAERQASESRMEVETEGYERPTEYRPKPSPHQPMSERDRLALRERREEAERPAREAAEKARRQQEQRERAEQTRLEKTRDLVMREPDPWFMSIVDTRLEGYGLPQKAADALNALEVEKFVQLTPEFQDFKSPETAKQMTSYLARNQVKICNAVTWRSVFNRLRELGVIRPTANPAPAQPVQRFESKPKETVTGRDPNTGGNREYSLRDIDRMTADEYKRAFPVALTVRDMLS
jgi:hypothetical protein